MEPTVHVPPALIASGCTRVTVEAVVIRKDGTREDHGVVSEWNASQPPQAA